MRGVEKAILELFKQDTSLARTTGEIVKFVTPGYSSIEQDLESKIPETVRAARYAKASLHRQILYHLNKLVAQGVLAVKTIGENKEKVFVLAETAVTTPGLHSLQHSAVPALPVEGLEQQKIIHRLEHFAWADRLNAILLETTQFKSASDLLHALNASFSSVNDAIGLNDFECFLQKLDAGTGTVFLRKLDNKCGEYGRKLTLVIDMTNLTSPDSVLSVVKNCLGEKKVRHLNFMYDVYPGEFHEHREFFEQLVKLYADAGEHLYIKNENVHIAPYILGRAGPYTFSSNAWKAYKSGLHGHLPGVVCAHATIMIDVARYFDTYPRTFESFTSLLLKVAKSLRVANENQRKRSAELIKGIAQFTPEQARHFFSFSTNYARFWNYGWKTPGINQESVVQFLTESKKAVDDYCISEETIYLSCGMPMRFRISYSCAFDEFVKDMFTRPLYVTPVIKKMEDYESPEFREIVKTKENVVRVLDGGDRITFYRSGTIVPEMVADEISHILTRYRVPFFRFNFGGKSRVGAQTLLKYFGDQE